MPSSGSALARLAVTELRLYTRDRLRLVFGTALPLLLVIIFGSIPYFNKPQAAYGGDTFLDVYVPIMVRLTAALLSLIVGADGAGQLPGARRPAPAADHAERAGPGTGRSAPGQRHRRGGDLWS